MHNGMGRRQTTGLVIIATSFGFLLQLLFLILHLILCLHSLFYVLNLGPDRLQSWTHGGTAAAESKLFSTAWLHQGSTAFGCCLMTVFSRRKRGAVAWSHVCSSYSLMTAADQAINLD